MKPQFADACDCAKLAKAPTDLVPHVLAEGLPARGPVFLADIESIEHVEVLEDRVTIAGHRQDAKQFGCRPAGAADLPFADRIGAAAGGKATQLGHVGSGQALPDRLTEIVAKLAQSRSLTADPACVALCPMRSEWVPS